MTDDIQWSFFFFFLLTISRLGRFTYQYPLVPPKMTLYNQPALPPKIPLDNMSKPKGPELPPKIPLEDRMESLSISGPTSDGMFIIVIR